MQSRIKIIPYKRLILYITYRKLCYVLRLVLIFFRLKEIKSNNRKRQEKKKYKVFKNSMEKRNEDIIANNIAKENLLYPKNYS